jgi:proton-dependent oligopeptide transporter, POT family
VFVGTVPRVSQEIRTTPIDSAAMPPGIPYIIGNEAAERFSFYGMRAILVVFMTKYLWLMDSEAGSPMSNAEATSHYHQFVAWVYFTPLLGALLSDIFLGKYRTIMLLSLLYCAGHAALACMGMVGNSATWLMAGLVMICLGSGGIKPCVSAHVGDQFGPKNQHLLTKIYNWFYFSINFGSFFSTLLTPWLLEWYGPHWAFGVPGVLMAIATFMFWLGRKQFIHVPAGGWKFFRELFSWEGLVALAKLLPLYLFIALFWALYDQTGSSWVLQAEQMDLNFLGISWLESQIQAINPILILLYIPLFTFLVYPLIHRFFPLTPLRKIGIGLFLVAASFALITLIQSWIDAGQRPSVGWQLLAYVVITAAEIMISIVGLEFSYTQSPKNMKSLVMAFYLFAVFVGNIFTAEINRFIQIPSSSHEQFSALVARQPKQWVKDAKNAILPGYDQQTGTEDDLIARIEEGSLKAIEFPDRTQQAFAAAAERIIGMAKNAGHRFPEAESLGADSLGKDPWGNAIEYAITSQGSCRLISAGPDRSKGTAWDIGCTIKISMPAGEASPSWWDRFHPQERWIDTRAQKLGKKAPEEKHVGYDVSYFSGGQTKLEGRSYYQFFTVLMLIFAVIYVPFAMLYRPKSYVVDGSEAES